MIILNKEIVQFDQFPNKESILSFSKLTLKALNRIEWLYENDEEFFHLSMLKDHIDSVFKKSELKVHYMPHSRMDRANEYHAESLKTACKLLNNMNFLSVTVVEPHSDVTPALLNNVCIDNFCQSKINDIVEYVKADSLFFPDAGAMKRYVTEMSYAVGNKMRNFKTGEITSFNITGTVGDKVLIVDDLCSKGGTFLHSAVALKKKGAKRVFLLTAHCETNVYNGDMFSEIECMFTGTHNLGLVESSKIRLI